MSALDWLMNQKLSDRVQGLGSLAARAVGIAIRRPKTSAPRCWVFGARVAAQIYTRVHRINDYIVACRA